MPEFSIEGQSNKYNMRKIKFILKVLLAMSVLTIINYHFVTRLEIADSFMRVQIPDDDLDLPGPRGNAI